MPVVAKRAREKTMSLLREIQNLASADGDVVTVLRKCKILAARLGSDEFANWVKWELDGYPEAQPTPEYRRLSVTYYASFMDVAWRVPQAAIPLQMVPEKHRESFQYVEFRDGIAKAISLTKKGATIQRPDLVFVLQGKMYPEMNCQAAWGQISGVEFEQLISAVKNRILDFSLKIEAENPDAGEAPPNTQPIPQEKLQPLVNNFFGVVGNVAQQSHDLSQTANITIQPQDLATLLAELTAHISELSLDARQKQRAEAQIATLKAQQITDQPDPVIVQQAGRILRNITEGAIGSLLATAVQPTVWHTIQHLLTLFPR